VPLVKPGSSPAGILAFIFSWNEFSIALNLTSRDTATVPSQSRASQQYEIQHSQMAAAAVISTLPALLLMALGAEIRRARAHAGPGQVTSARAG
jgi:multiple sugar transport system permease protein